MNFWRQFSRLLKFEETLDTSICRFRQEDKNIATVNAEAAASDIIAELRAEVVKLSTQLLAAQSAATMVTPGGLQSRIHRSATNPVEASIKRRIRRASMGTDTGAGRAAAARRSSIAALKAAELGGSAPERRGSAPTMTPMRQGTTWI